MRSRSPLSGQFSMMPIFDAAGARAARDRGITQAADGKAAWLEDVRQYALSIIDQRGEVTSDDLRRRFTLEAGWHFNTWGAVFKDRRFAWTGRYATSAIVAGHGNQIRIWRRA